MVRIAVFDSGLGSLSIIEPIQRKNRAEIIYFADSVNFPYGTKSITQLEEIIHRSLDMLREEFKPDLIVMASNTPSIVLDITGDDIIGVRPPISLACEISETKHIGLLGTRATIHSINLEQYIRDNRLDESYHVHKIDATEIIYLVESGKFLTDVEYCTYTIQNTIHDIIYDNNIDIMILSSTHLPFLRSILNDIIHDVRFIDPGDIVAQQVYDITSSNQSSQNSLEIFTSGDPNKLRETLVKLGIYQTVNHLSL